MKLLLSERLLLLTRHKKERDKRIADRIKVVLLYDDGWSTSQIAKALFIDDDTVRRHHATYWEENTVAPQHKGSDPLLCERESSSLAIHLVEHLYVKIKDIQEHVRKTYGKELSIATLCRWLKKNGFSYKKPKLVPAKSDVEAQKAFIAHYEKVMNEASVDGDPVLFGDSVHPSQQVRAAYGWVKRGQEKLVETHAGRKRVNIMGALNLETMSLVYQDFETINAVSSIDFLKTLEEAYPKAKKIHLIWDQAGYHRAEEVMEYLKTSRIRVHFLPPRSPNLNAIERLWKVMHAYVSNNRCYPKFKDFKAALFAFFDTTMPTIFDELVSRITDTFQILHTAKSL